MNILIYVDYAYKNMRNKKTMLLIRPPQKSCNKLEGGYYVKESKFSCIYETNVQILHLPHIEVQMKRNLRSTEKWYRKNIDDTTLVSKS